MLPDLEPRHDGQIVANNIRAVHLITTPLANWKTCVHSRSSTVSSNCFSKDCFRWDAGQARSCKRTMRSRMHGIRRRNAVSSISERLARDPGSARVAEPNREFHTLWLRLVTSVAMFNRRQERRGSGQTECGVACLARRPGAGGQCLGTRRRLDRSSPSSLS